MSEYWKSIPKYWCKFCATYVKDTKFERAQHEATGKHQGSVQRSLRTLHKEHDRGERDKQRAKDEVARLNGVVSGNPNHGSSGWKPLPAGTKPTAPKQNSAEERKERIQQLSAMGVAVPEEYRADMAIAGDWQTVSRKVVDEDVKPDAPSFGIRKRKLDGEEEEEEEAAQAALANKKRWGTAVRNYPGDAEETEDIEALLNGPKASTSAADVVKKEDDVEGIIATDAGVVDYAAKDEGHIKKEGQPTIAPIVFKKRKPKITT